MNEWQGKLKYWEETCLSAALSTTDSTILHRGSSSGHYSEKPAANRRIYGTASQCPSPIPQKAVAHHRIFVIVSSVGPQRDAAPFVVASQQRDGANEL
jgi:hypothetical protein